MLKLEDIKKDAVIKGIDANQPVRIISTEPVGGDALTVYYKRNDGSVLERMLFRTDEFNLELVEGGRPWSFDAPGEDFKLGVEAYRINLAHLFDPMMAVHTSNVEPLPHQITAVYESMLPRQPLRFILADDPGAGKTIMAGLFIRELLMRSDGRRILIVAPGSLVDQWQDEMFEKFGLDFHIFGREDVEQSRSGNPFEDKELLIVRLDQLSRDPELQEKLKNSHRWDLIVADEAHKLSASWFGSKINKTKRFELGELLGSVTRHLLLMTATPHNGKEEDFQLFLSLLDSDRFYGKFRDAAHKVDVSDLMRRMVKEELVKFDGKPLFPERRAYTMRYELSSSEYALYTAVTDYVKEQMNKADHMEDSARRGTVGFALTILQRRLASSPEAIYQSLVRRSKRLQLRLEEEKARQRGQINIPLKANLNDAGDVWESDEELSSGEYEDLEETVVDEASAAQTIKELEEEISILDTLVVQARALRASGQDRKWEELSRLLQNNPEMKDTEGYHRKLIIFTEHRDTLHYLQERVQGVIGDPSAVVMIHGGIKREERRKTQETFLNDKGVRILIATDAAGEGVNLQRANLMVNYDLPWNPNRIEQRFGRIHRIGQTEVCHLWNMVAIGTRESSVLERLCEKLEVESRALKGRVFNVLGEIFEGKSLKDLLIEAIRYGDDPAVKARLQKQVEGVFDQGHVREVLSRNALCEEIMDEKRLFAIKEEMEKAEARKLQPYFVRAFFNKAFQQLGGVLREREPGRYEINHVPALIRERDRQIMGRDRRNLAPVLPRYERICFEKHLVTPNRGPLASLVHPGHPLMQSVTDLILEAHRNKLKEGAVLVDFADSGLEPRILYIIDHSVKEGTDQTQVISRRMQFVYIDAKGNAVNAGWAPHLDLEAISQSDLLLIQDVIKASWVTQNLEQVALSYASQRLVPEHFEEVKQRRYKIVDKTLQAVHERLVKEINYWQDRYIKFQDDLTAGKDVRLTLENVKRTIDDLTARLATRKKELEGMRQVISATPVIVGGSLIIPAGLLAQRKGEHTFCADPEARKRIEKIAMQAVMDTEQGLGYDVFDVSAERCGWDVTARPKKQSESLDPVRHIEVKGRTKGEATITVTRNEILYGLNQSDKFILAIVLVDGEKAEGPFYVRKPFTQEPDWAVTSINMDLNQILGKAHKPK